MIIFALDYAGTELELQSSIKDGRAMADLARTHCGVTSIIEHYERRCTPANLEHAFGQVSKKMQNDDYLIFYFAGHGAELHSGLADEDAQAFDDGDVPLAFHLFESNGRVTEYSCGRFAELVSNSVNPKARILMMFDCGHSQSMVDLTNPAWDDIEAMSLTGHEDKEESEDTGYGGAFTMGMLLAVQSLQKQGDMHYSVGGVFNKMLKDVDRVSHGGEAHFWLEHSLALSPNSMAWPLLPTTKYYPPVKRQQAEPEKAKVNEKKPWPGFTDSFGTKCKPPNACNCAEQEDRNSREVRIEAV